MSERSKRRWLLLVGLGVCALGTGCQAAAEVGSRAIAAAVGDAIKSAREGGPSTDPVAASEPTASFETPCRKKQREWRKKDGNPRAEPPPYLRCGEKGVWPDENEVRSAGSTPGF